MLKNFHIMLAYLTVLGFVVRGVWSLLDSPMRQEKWVKIAPHVIDTLLLTLGVLLVIDLGLAPFSGWLSAKLLGLVAYIGFGVLAMRAQSRSLKIFGFSAALLCVGYIFAVAFTRSAWPLVAA
ncbi:MAG: SirB2 family protein [Gammaproteobacteria bacterium]|nr:SirB2 family protein [Gammaproteobacteria bacterium]MCZ6711212.1 SirB2 family protein [Gammaproteobacteria bacterium]